MVHRNIDTKAALLIRTERLRLPGCSLSTTATLHVIGLCHLLGVFSWNEGVGRFSGVFVSHIPHDEVTLMLLSATEQFYRYEHTPFNESSQHFSSYYFPEIHILL